MLTCLNLLLSQLSCQLEQTQAILCQYLIWEEDCSSAWTPRASCTTRWVFYKRTWFEWSQETSAVRFNNLCLSAFVYPTEAKGQRRLSLPAHLVRSGQSPWCVLLYQCGPAAQTGRSKAKSCSPSATQALLSHHGEVPWSLGKETKEEWGGEPLWSVKIRVTSLTSCQGSQGCRSQAARTGPGRRRFQRDHHVVWRPPAGLTGQRARQSCQD